MKKYHKELVEETIETKICDKCNEPVIENYDGNENEYNYFYSTIKIKEGYNDYYEGRIPNIEYSLDLCRSCALELFENILPSLGYKINDDL